MEAVLASATSGPGLQHLKDAVELAADVVALGGLDLLCVLRFASGVCIFGRARLGGAAFICGVCILRLVGGCCIQRRDSQVGDLLHLFGRRVLCRHSKGVQDGSCELVHCVPAFLRRFGGIMYCNTGPRPPSRDNGQMIADNVGLLVSVAVWLKPAVIPAGHLPHDAVFHIRYKRRVFDDEVGDGVFALPAHIFDVPLGICSLIDCREHLRRVPVGDVLALKAGKRRRGKDILRQSVYCDGPVGVSLDAQLPGGVGLRAGAVDGHIPADEIALRGLVDMLADGRAVVDHHSTPGTSSSWSALSPATASSSRSAMIAW